MTDEGTIAETLRRESRSYLQYIRESFPWAKGKNESTRATVLSIASAEDDALQSIGRSLQKRHMALPALGGFPAAFTTSNFIAVEYLIPRLIVAQQQGIVALTSNLDSIRDPGIRQQLQTLLELKTQHLHQLESLRTV